MLTVDGIFALGFNGAGIGAEWLSISKSLRQTANGGDFQLRKRREILEGGKPMSETGLAAVMLIVIGVAIVMSFWRQIAILLLYVFVTVFCAGVYFIVSTITYM